MTAVTDRLVLSEPGFYDNVRAADYHRDPVPGGSLSSTGARLLTPPNPPAKFDHYRRFGRPDSATLSLGRAAHTEILGAGDPIVVIEGTGKDPNSWNTNAAKDAVAEARAAGMTPVTPAQREQITAMGEALRAHPQAGPLFARPGVAERVFVWQDPETGIWCRLMTDWMPDVPAGARVLVVDYKTAADASPSGFAKSVWKYGYHQQGPFYCDGVTACGADNGQPPVFVLVAQEKEPPYLVTVNLLPAFAIEAGQAANRKARHVYRECTESGVWPGYTDPAADLLELETPAWAAREFDAALMAGTYDVDEEDR